MSNLQEVLNKLKQDIQNTLENEVAEVVKNKEIKHIEFDVYNKYRIDQDTGEITEPYLYKRRYDNGGLQDKNNIITIPTENGIIIKNITKGKNDNFDLADLIEGGDGYNGLEYTYKDNRDYTSYQYLEPRPFQENTVEELKETKEHIDVLKKGLKKQGYNCK